MSLRDRAVSGLVWSFIDDFAKLGLSLIRGVILARLLSPREFGLIGMTTIFIAVSQSFVDSGFKQALIRKKDCTQADFSTVFYFNMFVSVVLYAVLFVSAGAIATFFDEPVLGPVLRVLGLGLIINAVSLVQQTQLTKNINFRLQTRISVIASIVSGALGIYMAFAGYGVWSLVASTLSGLFLVSLLLWLWRDWRPSLMFSLASFREMFSFGSRLLVSGLLNTVYRNVYNLVIGKYFSAAELGYYTRADTFQKLPSQHLSGVIQRVSYPVLSAVQDDMPRLRVGYRRVIKNTMLVSFVLMLGMAAVAEPMVVTLVGEQWRPSVVYLQLLCLVGMFYPLHAINLNMLKVQGRSDLFLKLEVIKKVLAIPVIVVGVLLGIEVMIGAMFVNTLIAYYLNSYWSGELIGYPVWGQIRDILPSLLLGAFVGSAVYLFGHLLSVSGLLQLVLQVILGGVLTVGIAELLQMESFLHIKGIALERALKQVEAR